MDKDPCPEERFGAKPKELWASLAELFPEAGITVRVLYDYGQRQRGL
jgi:hypothetical protein